MRDTEEGIVLIDTEIFFEDKMVQEVLCQLKGLEGNIESIIFD